MTENRAPEPPRIERWGRLQNQDNPFAALLRFLLEVAAWVAIWRAWGYVALLVGAAALALFNARGDKQVTGIAVPGAMRLLLEFGVMIAGIFAINIWLGSTAAWLMAGALLLQTLLGWRRYRWLLAQ